MSFPKFQEPQSRSARAGIAATVLLSATCFFAGAADAQVLNNGVGIGPSTLVAKPEIPAPASPPLEHIFGDWGGIRTYLASKGIGVIVDDWAEIVGNATGGFRKKADFAGQVGLEVDLDWNRIAGIPGLTTTATVVQRHGRRLSTDALADDVYNPAQIYGGGGDVAAHLVYLYAQESLAHGRVVVTGGRYTVGADFDSSPLVCLFMGLAICGQPRVLTTTVGFSSWPSTAWGGDFRVRPTPLTYFMGGIFQTTTTKGGRAGLTWGTAASIGETFPFEFGYEPLFGRNKLAGHYKVGVIYDDSSTKLNAATDTVDPGHVKGHLLEYVNADQMFVRNGPYSNSGLIGIAGYVHSDSRTTIVSDQFDVALEDVGFMPSRPFDAIGVVYSYFKYGQNVAANTRGFATPSAVVGFTGPIGEPVLSKHQSMFEAAYNIHAYRGVDIAPDFQYVVRPGGSGKVPDAAVFGVNMHFSL